MGSPEPETAAANARPIRRMRETSVFDFFTLWSTACVVAYLASGGSAARWPQQFRVPVNPLILATITVIGGSMFVHVRPESMRFVIASDASGRLQASTLVSPLRWVPWAWIATEQTPWTQSKSNSDGQLS